MLKEQEIEKIRSSNGFNSKYLNNLRLSLSYGLIPLVFFLTSCSKEGKSLQEKIDEHIAQGRIQQKEINESFKPVEFFGRISGIEILNSGRLYLSKVVFEADSTVSYYVKNPVIDSYLSISLDSSSYIYTSSVLYDDYGTGRLTYRPGDLIFKNKGDSLFHIQKGQ